MGEKRGRKKLPVGLRRSERLVVTFTPGQLDDMRVISDAWDEPLATVAWVIIATWLAERRSEGLAGDPELASRLADWAASRAARGA